ncbi:hypothetical protein M427DRAFT_57582 [Gonapodya prolifera JEL478]|uniref:Arb2 domain-containing protein n=1 Tax=Gonapodya prolifera (strain JEL478) TaxID=1344416 RepID=A0A139ACB1_GONPJ|nr:hypothetical protein M427DRAFT_57582 [Gonapodya prolifera JEL478]|eukprot:KXS14407.1 hypothetical protein M427DRAFT_57582 [Gonapodya prolifera JEL478]
MTLDMSSLGYNTGSANSAHSFPTAIDGFGYEINDAGELRQKESGERFVFEVMKGDRAYNQAHYEALGDAVAKAIESRLEDRGLRRIVLPVGSPEDQPHSYIFATDNVTSHTGHLMVLVPGSNIRVGQWARKIVMNDSVYRGSVLEYVDRAISDGYALLVLNTNGNSWTDAAGAVHRVPHNGSPVQHLAYVWDNIIAPSPASSIFIVAHSAGGAHTVDMIESRAPESTLRIAAVSFTDSVHSSYQIPRPRLPWYEENTINFIASKEPVGKVLGDRSGTPARSSGHHMHEYTTPCAVDVVFEFFRSKWSSAGRVAQALQDDEDDEEME